MSIPTAEQLAEWRELTNKATEGPWVATDPADSNGGWADDFDYPMVVTDDSTPSMYSHIARDFCQGLSEGLDDAKFTAMARTAMPLLLDAVEQLTAKLTRSPPVVDIPRWDDGEPRHPCTYTCTHGERCLFSEPRPRHGHDHGHLGFNDCTWSTRAPVEYPNARCDAHGKHHGHRWGETAHWCDGIPRTPNTLETSV